MRLKLGLAVAAALVTALAAQAAEPVDDSDDVSIVAGQIEHIDSNVEDDLVQVKNDDGVLNTDEDDDIYEDDHIVTRADQTVSVRLNDGSELVVGPSTDLVIDQAYEADEPTTRLGLVYGMLHSLVQKIYSAEHPFVVQTPQALMGVRGTEFVAEHDAASGESNVHTLEGAVAMGHSDQDLKAPSSSVVYNAGTSGGMSRADARPRAPQTFDHNAYFQSLSKRSPRFVRHIQTKAKMRRNHGHWAKRRRKKARGRRKPPKHKKHKHRKRRRHR